MTMPVTEGMASVLRRIRLRRAYAEDWARVNPILMDGEPGYDKTQNMVKVGDGQTPWNRLRYLNPPITGSPTPGTGTVNSAHIHVQTTPSASWLVSHSLGRLPSVDLYVDGSLVEADVEADLYIVTVTFPSPMVGSAVLI